VDSSPWLKVMYIHDQAVVVFFDFTLQDTLAAAHADCSLCKWLIEETEVDKLQMAGDSLLCALVHFTDTDPLDVHLLEAFGFWDNERESLSAHTNEEFVVCTAAGKLHIYDTLPTAQIGGIMGTR